MDGGGAAYADVQQYQTWPRVTSADNAALLEVPDEVEEEEESVHASDGDGGLGASVKVFHTPHDRLKLAFSSFVLIGAGLLFPWNSILSAVDFWSVRFPHEKTEFYFSVSYQTLNIIALALVVLYGARVSFRARIVPGFVVYCACMAVLPASHSLELDIAVVAVLGGVDAVVQGTVFALAGLFSPRYTAALMTGQGISAVCVSVLRIVTKAAMPSTHAGTENATYIFFGLSCAVIVLCVAAYILVLERSPVTAYYLDHPRRARDKEFEMRLAASKPSRFATMAPVPHASQHAHSMIPDEDDAPDDEGPEPSILTIFGKIYPMGLSVFCVFWVTLALFPGITSELKSTDASINTGTGSGWYPVIMILLFDVGDLIGRTLPNWDRLIVLGPRGVAIGAVVRVVFVATFIMALKREVFTTDASQYVMMLLFSVSNGYLGTLCMMFGTEGVARHEKELAGTMMVFLLTGGLTLGVWSGLLIQHLV